MQQFLYKRMEIMSRISTHAGQNRNICLSTHGHFTRDTTIIIIVLLILLLALHSHSSEPLSPVAQRVGLVPRAALPPMVAPDNADVVNRAARDLEHQLQVGVAQNQDDKNNYKLDDLPDEGTHIIQLVNIIRFTAQYFTNDRG